MKPPTLTWHPPTAPSQTSFPQRQAMEWHQAVALIEVWTCGKTECLAPTSLVLAWLIATTTIVDLLFFTSFTVIQNRMSLLKYTYGLKDALRYAFLQSGTFPYFQQTNRRYPEVCDVIVCSSKCGHNCCSLTPLGFADKSHVRWVYSFS